MFVKLIKHRAGFTLLELLLAMSIMALVSTLSFFAFHQINRSWQIGREVINANGHADYVIEQLTAALRSAYTPGEGDAHGFIFEDDGEGDSARDKISWTKVGRALIGDETGFTDVPHRIEVYVTEEDEGDYALGGFTVKSWRQDLQLDEFDPEEDVKEIYLSPEVIAFNCRMLDPDQPEKDEEPNWIDEWTKTNSLPSAVEITLYLKAPEEGAEPIEAKRIVEIPLASLSQNPGAQSNSDSGKTGTGSGGGSSGGGSGGGGSSGGGSGGGRPPSISGGSSGSGGGGNSQRPNRQPGLPQSGGTHSLQPSRQR